MVEGIWDSSVMAGGGGQDRRAFRSPISGGPRGPISDADISSDVPIGVRIVLRQYAPLAVARYCPNCVKRTDGRGHPLKQPRGRALWPKALQLRMRFHDLRHTFAA